MLVANDKNLQKLPHLAITIGDPAGVGREIVLKALTDPLIQEICQVTVVGSRSLLQQTCILEKNAFDRLSIIDIPLDRAIEKQIIVGTGNAASGAASFAYLEAAIARTLAGEFHGIVTAPIAKSCWKAAGHDYPGQTEVLAHQAGVEKFGMLFVARSPHTEWILRTLLATTHIPLNQVSTVLTPQLMTLKLDLLIDSLQKDFGIESPQIVIAGLNPHSGEAGQLGTEERDWLIPWIAEEQKKRPHVQLIGPLPPDTMWVKPGQAWYGNDPQVKGVDGYLALYHDQGLIPVKLMAFDRAVNTTIGLPFIRTSPDHGTAFDIAGKGIASESSMKEAIKLAAELAKIKFSLREK
jgi:4-hydroxythreonine-4-phosphate dehydrogenase